MKRVLSVFTVAFIWLSAPAAGQILLPPGRGLSAPSAHILDAPDTCSEEHLPNGHLKWTPRAPLSSPRYALAAATAPDGSIFAIGGADGASSSAVVEVYRPTSKQWSVAPSLPRPRYRLAAATGGDGRIYAIGGSDPGGEGAFLSSVLALTPGADQWVPVAAMSVGRQLLAATAGADGRIFAVGGHNGRALNLLEIYDPARDQWTTGAPMLTPRYEMGVALGGDGRIYAIGGCGDGFFNVFDSVEAYSPATDVWEPVAPLPSRRCLVDAAAGPDGRIYAIGGCELVTDAAGNPVDCVISQQVDVYSPQMNVWQTLSPTADAHWEGAATARGTRIFAIGGHTEAVESARVPHRESRTFLGPEASSAWTCRRALSSP
jgi:N-acetylneuraminic acid mutarotase